MEGFRLLKFPIHPITGELDESEVPLDEIQTRFFLLRDDGGVGCRFCPDFFTKEQKRPLYPLRDHVHSVHYNILPYRCSDCPFKTSSYRFSFAHAQTAGHRRCIVQRTTSTTPSTPTFAKPEVGVSKKKRKSNPLGEDLPDKRWIAEDTIVLKEPVDVVDAFDTNRVVPTTTTPNPSSEAKDAAYVVPSFLPTPPLTPRIESEYFRYDVEGSLQCSKCDYRVPGSGRPSSKKTLLEHVYNAHIENLPWTCKDCQFSTKFRSNLTRHCRKMRHSANVERYAPPGDKEPDTRVVAASAKRVKWTWGELHESSSPQQEDLESKYSVPMITPTDRLAWQSTVTDATSATTTAKTTTKTTSPSKRRKSAHVEKCDAVASNNPNHDPLQLPPNGSDTRTHLTTNDIDDVGTSLLPYREDFPLHPRRSLTSQTRSTADVRKDDNVDDNIHADHDDDARELPDSAARHASNGGETLLKSSQVTSSKSPPGGGVVGRKPSSSTMTKNLLDPPLMPVSIAGTLENARD